MHDTARVQGSLVLWAEQRAAYTYAQGSRALHRERQTRTRVRVLLGVGGTLKALNACDVVRVRARRSLIELKRIVHAPT